MRRVLGGLCFDFRTYRLGAWQEPAGSVRADGTAVSHQQWSTGLVSVALLGALSTQLGFVGSAEGLTLFIPKAIPWLLRAGQLGTTD